MWTLTPPKDLIPANGYIVVYGKDQKRIDEILKMEADIPSLFHDRIICLNAEERDLWFAILIGVFVIGCYGIPPYVLEEHGAIIQGLF